MLNIDSLTTYFLFMISRVANIKDDNNKINEIGWNVSWLGLNTIITPTNPTRVAIHRRAETFSPKNIGAIIKMNNGMVNVIIVAVAIGTRFKPKIQIAIPKYNNEPRITCIIGLGVLNDFIPP